MQKNHQVYESKTLNNGIRIIHRQVNSDVAHCGILVNVGTRDENEDQIGIAHFTEHLLFKGTSKRRAYHILNRMESVGGEIDAYTTKEETCLMSSFLVEFYERAIELLDDVVFNSTFPQKEIEKERDVIIDEINSYKDSPSDNIFDEFEEYIFENHPLGHNILGTKKSLKKFKTGDFIKFVGENYSTDKIIFCSVGNIEFSKLTKLCEKYIGKHPARTSTTQRLPFRNNIKFEKIQKNAHTHQSNCVLGNYAYSYSNPKRLPLFLLSNILAGPGMNTRLNLSLREHHGLSYNIESNYSTYEDTGLFSIYFSSDKDKVDNAINLIFKELENIKTKKMGTLQLSRAQKQLIGQVAIESEVNSSTLFSMGKSFMIYNKAEGLQETMAMINSITAEQIMEVANEIFDRDKFSTLIYL